MVSQAFGYSVTLVCAVEAFPPAAISWSHQSILKSDNEDNLSIDNGRNEEDDNKSVYRGILGSDGFTSSTLRVNRLRPEDLGAYTCSAANSLGTATASAEVATVILTFTSPRQGRLAHRWEVWCQGTFV